MKIVLLCPKCKNYEIKYDSNTNSGTCLKCGVFPYVDLLFKYNIKKLVRYR